MFRSYPMLLVMASSPLLPQGAATFVSRERRRHHSLGDAAKLYKLKHLTKVEVISSDPSGCTFVLENIVTLDNQDNNKEGQETSVATQTERKVTAKVTVENDLVSQAKDDEEDMETLLDTYVMGIGEADAFSERLK
ncbi:hypothetical protein ZWY2020_057388 [Hordeum vulgare]|nr:hypothetical protein ZWY2020_057388 [Hordeum vulgare]